MFYPNTHYSQMNFGAARQFSSRLLASILLQLQDTGSGLFVDKTRGAGFVVLYSTSAAVLIWLHDPAGDRS
jgi:hypothetical protein